MANIRDKINQIRTALFGKEVRGALAEGLEAVNNETENTTANQKKLESKFEELVINAGNSLGDLNSSIEESKDIKQQLEEWVQQNKGIVDLNQKVDKKTRIEVCDSQPIIREKNTFYFIVTKTSSGGVNNELKVSPSMGIKIV